MGATEEKIALIIEAYNKTKGAFDELSNSLKNIDDGHKKINQNSESMFQKLKANWVAVSVAVGAVALAVREAFEYMEKGAKAQQAEDAFRSVAAAAGESADEILEAMKRASNGTVDDSAIMQKAVKGMIQGLSGDQMIKIMEMARVAARTSGQDISQTFDTITDAISTKMPRSLLQYRLVTKEQTNLLSNAMAMGVTEVDLFALAVENMNKQLAKTGPLSGNAAEQMQKWKAQFEEFQETVGKGLFEYIIKPFASLGEKIGINLASAVMRIQAVWDWAKSGFKGGVNEILGQLNEEEQRWKAAIEEVNQKYGYSPKPTNKPTPNNKPNSKTSPSDSDGADATLRAIVKNQQAIAALEDQLTNLDSAEKMREISHLDAAEKRLQIEQKIVDTLQTRYDAKGADGKDLISDPNARAALLKQIDEAKKKMTDFGLALRDLSDDFKGGFKEGLAQYIDQVGSTFQKAVKLAQAAAQAMEQAFSDFFFDAMTGKLKSLSDYVMNFLLAIARAVANFMAQSMVTNLLSSFGMGATAPTGGGGGGGGYATVPALHSGGYIMHSGGYVPRFHIGGLNSDEVPAILQKGEYVVSRKGVAALDKINNGDGGGGIKFTMNVDNQTGTPINAKNTGVQFDGERYVVGVVLKNIDQGGPIRHAITGLGGA